MADDEIARLEEEIRVRQRRLSELRGEQVVTRDELKSMTPDQIRALDPKVVGAALAE